MQVECSETMGRGATLHLYGKRFDATVRAYTTDRWSEVPARDSWVVVASLDRYPTLGMNHEDLAALGKVTTWMGSEYARLRRMAAVGDLPQAANSYREWTEEL